MLVLSRRESERIRLGDSIVVTVIRVVGDRVRLGIEAPSDVLVLRDELEPRPDERPLTLASGLLPDSVEVAKSP
jgi:carbon storage regulator